MSKLLACNLDADFVSLYADSPAAGEPWHVCIEHVERSGWTELVKAYPHDRRDAALAHAQHEAKRRTMALYYVGFDCSLTPIPMGPGVVLVDPLEAADDASQTVWQVSICRGRDVHTLGEWSSLADAVTEGDFAADECGMPLYVIDPTTGLWTAPADMMAPAVA